MRRIVGCGCRPYSPAQSARTHVYALSTQCRRRMSVATDPSHSQSHCVRLCASRVFTQRRYVGGQNVASRSASGSGPLSETCAGVGVLERSAACLCAWNNIRAIKRSLWPTLPCAVRFSCRKDVEASTRAYLESSAGTFRLCVCGM